MGAHHGCVGGAHLDAYGRDPTPLHGPGLERPPTDGEPFQHGRHLAQLGTGVDQGAQGTEAMGDERGLALAGDGQVGRAGRDHEDAAWALGRGPPGEGALHPRPARVAGQGGGGLLIVGPREQHRAAPGLLQQLGHDGGALLGRLPRGVDGLGDALAERAVVIDTSEAQVDEGQAPEAL